MDLLIEAFAELLLAILGSLIVLTYSWSKFNEPQYDLSGATSTWKPASANGANPHGLQALPRHMTSPALYQFWRFIYVIVMQVFYVVLVWSLPESIDAGEKERIVTSDTLLAALILTGLAPHTPWIQKQEERFRRFFHTRASIPKAAADLAARLVRMQLDFEAETVRKLVAKPDEPVDAAYFEAAPETLERCWARAMYLRWGIKEWARQVSAVGVYQDSPGSGWLGIEQSYGELRHLMALYLEQPAVRNASAYKQIGTDMDSLLRRMCEFVSVALLFSEVSQGGRTRRLAQLGFHEDVEPARPDLEAIVELLLLIGVPIFGGMVFMSVSLETIADTLRGSYPIWETAPIRGVQEALRWALLGAASHAVPILALLLTKRALAVRNWWPLAENAVSAARHPHFYLMGAGIGFGLGLLVLMALGSLIPTAVESSEVSASWGWYGFLPATTGFLVAYHMDTHPSHAYRLREMLIQGSAMLLVGYLVALQENHATGLTWSSVPAQYQVRFFYTVLVSATIGLLIGAVFPHHFRRLVTGEPTAAPIAAEAALHQAG